MLKIPLDHSKFGSNDINNKRIDQLRDPSVVSFLHLVSPGHWRGQPIPADDFNFMYFADAMKIDKQFTTF